ncbi:uncharacterized protein LOC135134883 [Zophobas morio]|uniref:uncharacterized protein LOC135134883 n=1 Tax=Zophobas morio TaxID=2755281 RepID=UPI00308290B8
MDPKRRNKSNKYCCVPMCTTYYSSNISFHKFPTLNKLLRQKWINALKIGKEVSQHMVVCSKHFRDEDYFLNRRYQCKLQRLKPNAVPSENLPKRMHDREINENLIFQRQQRSENRKKNKEIKSMQQQENEFRDHEGSVETMNIISITHDQDEVDVAEVLTSWGHSNAPTNVKEYADKGVQVNTYEEFNQFDVSDIINTDYKLRILTGIQSLAFLNLLTSTLAQHMKIKSKLNIKKLILLSLMRLKLDVPFTSLSIFFNVSHTTAQTYFQRIITNLAFCLKSVIRFPSQQEIKRSMPICFQNYSNTRIVLDCTELEIEKCKCLKCRIRTYSFYKGRHTVKFLIGVAPSGTITYLSKPYGGRASDKAIFNKENMISKFSPGDGIMVDKGFLIDKECANKGIQLIRPPFLKKKKQLTKAEALRTAEIARARVHVERAIQRIKKFKICRNILPFKLLRNINSIVIVIVALTNLSSPILSVDKF